VSKARLVSFVASMGALGNLLFAASQSLLNLGQIALDLSHLATYIVALHSGPYLGLMTGLIVGLGPGLYFGYIGGQLGALGLLGLPVGKALTGLTAGLLARRIVMPTSAVSTAFLILSSFVPECLFTVVFFKVFVPLFVPAVSKYLVGLLIPILAKAWTEIAVIAVLISMLNRSKGFSDFLRKYLSS